jgi:outer membrane receptor protein involved in Fe transport
MNNLVQKLMLGCSAAAMITTLAARAQGQPVADSEIEQVTVSGSRITLGGFTAPTPVTVVGKEQLESNAYANISDSVRQLPQVNSPPTSFGVSQGAASPGTAGANLLNLRNLGVNRTLILFDRQRVVESNLTGGVDITTLPNAIVQRVDVVTGGASAAWGSDAVAGVVNFVIDKNFVGVKGQLQGSSTTSGLYRSISGNGVWGTNFDGDRGHVEIAGSFNIRPDTVTLMEQKWYRGTYLVQNPGVSGANASASSPIFVLADHVGLANSTQGGIIQNNPAGVIGGVAVPNTLNSLRGIRFGRNGTVQQVNFGNLTNCTNLATTPTCTLSNGGSLTDRDSEAPWQTLSGPGSTYSLFAHGRYKITSDIQASLQLNYGYYTGKGDAQSFQNLNMTVYQDNAYLPTSVRDAMVAGGIPRFVMGTLNGNNFDNYAVTGETYTAQAYDALAPATTYNRRQMMRGVFTLDGTLWDDWSWNAYYSTGQTRFSVRTRGVAVLANLQAAQDAVLVTAANRGNSGLALGSIACRSTLTGVPVTTGVNPNFVTSAPGCLPLNSFGEGVADPAAIRYVTNNNSNFENMTMTLDVFEASMEGKLPWSLPAGDIATSFGFGWRKQGGKNVATTIGDKGGYAVANYTNFPASHVGVWEGFLEVNAPILKDQFVQSLDFNAAGRITDYSTSGMVETWKLGFTSQVIDDIRLRATWSVDIRAPTIQDLFAPANVNTGSCTDPKTNATQSCINNVLGNPDLAPEVARTISGGMVVTPTWIPGLSFSLDWYNINLTGQIATLSLNLIQSTCRAQWLAAGNLNNPLCDALVFNSSGVLAVTNRIPININSLRTSGMDLQANYAWEMLGGSFSFNANANYVDEITLLSFGNSVPNDYAGVLGAGGAANASGSPKWKGLVSLGYRTGPWSATVQARWYGSAILNNAWNGGNQATASSRWTVLDSVQHVDPTAYVDLRASYQWNENIQLYAAVDNLFNIPPQMVPGYFGSIQSNGGPIHSVTQYDMLGREVRAGIRFNFN